MARGKQNKLYRNFTQGLITEAGFLTYPQNASTDELNTIISPKGNRNRRLGIEKEPEGIDVPLDIGADNAITTEFTWRAAANKFDRNFFVQQIGGVVKFFAINDEPLSTHAAPFVINLLDYKTAAATNDKVNNSKIQFASGKGFLFAVGEYIEPIVIEFLPATNSLSIIRVILQVRDFDGVPDGLANDAEPSTLSPQHFYNLKNQGWLTPGSV